MIKEFDIHGSSGDISELVEHEQKKSKKRFSSTTSKDSGHNSETIDRSTTDSSSSSSSKLSSKSFHGDIIPITSVEVSSESKKSLWESK